MFNYVCYTLSLQLGPKFTAEKGLKHVIFSSADGALEAAPAVRLSPSVDQFLLELLCCWI